MRCGCNCGSVADGTGCLGGKHCYRPQNGCTRTAVA